MQPEGSWLEFEVGPHRYALPVSAVSQVCGLEKLQPRRVTGWAGLLALRGATLPVADGGWLLGAVEPTRRARCLVIGGEQPLGLSADRVVGLVTGTACALVDRPQIPELAVAALPQTDGTTIVLDADRLWCHLRKGLVQSPDGRGFRLQPLTPAARPEPAAVSELEASENKSAALPMSRRRQEPAPFLGGEVLVFRAGLPIELAVPLDQVLAVGPSRIHRSLPGGPSHLAGLLEWRGRLIPVVDLAGRLGGRRAEPGQILYVTLPGRAARAIAIKVAEVAGPARVPQVGPALPELGVPRAWSRGAARLGQRPLVVLDPASLAVV